MLIKSNKGIIENIKNDGERTMIIATPMVINTSGADIYGTQRFL